MYYKELFDSKTNSIKQLWRNINAVWSFKKSQVNATSIKHLKVNNLEITQPNEICSAFNNYFSSIGQKLVDLLPVTDDTNGFASYMDKPVVNSMFCDPVERGELVKLITSLNPNKSSGPDDIHPKIVRDVAIIVAEPLRHIFNLSLTSGVVPDALKVAKVVPVFKKGDAKLASNYRPISLLSVFDKILERTVYNRVYGFFIKYNILNQHQFGFRKKHSTVMALMEVIDKILEGLDRGEAVAAIYLDLQKAFDTVDHSILLQKLNSYGIRGNIFKWFQSYLSNRKQFTTINKFNSEPLTVSCGVPQGSILGPLLFLIYVNDICNVTNEDNINLFADDTNLLVFGSNEYELANKATLSMISMSKWFIVNKLSLSVEKSCYTVFPAKRFGNISILIDNCKLTPVKTYKYLGVFIDDNLKWIDHIEYVYKKIVKYVGVFYKLRSILPYECLKNLYFAFIHPHILYAIEVYGTATVSHLNKLAKLNNKILRILQFKNIRSHVGELYRSFNTLPIFELYDLQIATVVHKVIHHPDEVPAIYRDYFALNVEHHNYDTRRKQDIHVVPIKTAYGQRRIRYTGPNAWNQLPNYLKVPCAVRTFRNKYKVVLTAQIA